MPCTSEQPAQLDETPAARSQRNKVQEKQRRRWAVAANMSFIAQALLRR